MRLAAQNGAVRALMEAGDPDDAVRGLLRAVCENLEWQVGAFWRADAPGDVLRLREQWSDPVADVSSFTEATAGATFTAGDGLPGRVWASGEPAWIVDVVEEGNFPRADAARDSDLHGGFAVPVPVGAGETAVLEFLTREVLEPDRELLETIAAVGGQLGQFLQRRQAERELRASEERFRTFALSVADATFVIDDESRIVYVNEAVRTIFGYSPEELIGEPLTRLMPQRHRASHMHGMNRFLETGERRIPWDGVQLEGLRRDGTEVPLEITYGTFEQDGRRYFTGIARDITERRRSEERLRFQARLLDAVGEAVIATDLEGIILYWNAFAEELYGWKSEEVIGKPVAEITPAELSREEARQILRQLQEGRPWRGEFMVRNREGREFPVVVNDSPILDERGDLIGIIGTSSEISERKRAEEAQRFLAEAGRVLASSLDYQTTLRSVADLAVPTLGDWCLVHLFDEDGRPSTVARAVPTEDEDRADSLETEISGVAPEFARAVEAGSGTGKGAVGRGLIGDERLAELGVRSLLTVPLRAREHAFGTMTFAITTSRRRYDEHDARLAEELGRRAASAIDNARLYRDAEEGNRAKADFLAVVSHELRTPLNAIAGYAELLTTGIGGELTEKQRQHVSRIKVGANHLTHLINEILTYSRVEAGRESLDISDADIAALAREAAIVLEPVAADKGLALDVDTPDDGPVVRTDAGKVRQILVNLLSNAVKYTESGRVELRVRAAPDGVEIVVRDTGVGIEPEHRERIFEPFWQAQSPNTRTTGGTGLGLSVNRELVRLLGGSMTLESAVGEGSTFTVRLPAAAPTGPDR